MSLKWRPFRWIYNSVVLVVAYAWVGWPGVALVLAAQFDIDFD
jgi:hypothetical protein